MAPPPSDFKNTHIFPGIEQRFISLRPLTKSEFLQLVEQHLGKVNENMVKQLWLLSKGSPGVGVTAMRAIQRGLFNWEQLLHAFDDFKRPGILGPDGQPIDSRSVAAGPIVMALTHVNDELIKRIRASPDILRSISPRQFEEVVADLLHRLGYDVELTPASKDGGFDIYAAKKETVGRFLYLVECKRYLPPAKVGVQIVRSLHGVVQQRRATAGIVATTSFFTKGARELQQELAYQIQLNDYFELQKWLQLV